MANAGKNFKIGAFIHTDLLIDKRALPVKADHILLSKHHLNDFLICLAHTYFSDMSHAANGFLCFFF